MVDNKSTSMYFLLIQNDVKLQRLTRQCSRPQTRYVSGWVKVMFAAADRQLVTGIIANIPGIIFWIMMATIRIPAIDGLIQRLGIVFIFIWIGVMSLKMLKLKI